MMFDHLAIWTRDLEKMKDFYVHYFQGKANERYDNEKKNFSSYFVTFPNGIRIELMKKSDAVYKNTPCFPGYSHFAVRVGSKAEVDEITERFRTEGIVIESEPRTTGDGYYESVIRDPENNLIEIISYK